MRRFFLLVAIIVVGLTACTPITEKKLDVAFPERPPVENYKLVAGDVVRVDVYQQPEMSGAEQRIAQDGTINIPLAGVVRIGGLTTEAAGQAIAASLEQGYLVDPQVTVTILQYSPRRFTLIGQVNQPGSFEMPGEELVTLPEAIAMGGGNTAIGNLHRVLVSRKRDGALYEYKVNALHPAGRQFLVEPGDVITVPESLF